MPSKPAGKSSSGPKDTVPSTAADPSRAQTANQPQPDADC